MSDLFLSLVRLGIGHQAVPIFGSQVSSEVDWVLLKALADQHGLSAVVLDGLNEVSKSNSQLSALNSQLKLSWIGEVMQNYEAWYHQYEKAIGSLAGFYNRHGYKIMVLKGYTYSLNWPNPEHRPCGDIDIWQFGQHKEADALLEETNTNHTDDTNDFKIDKSHHHHTVFNWMGFAVENHYDFENVHHHKSSVELEKVFKELGKDDSHFVEIEGASTGTATRIYLPSPNHHALLLLKNSMTDFAAFYVTLRHVLDWGFHVEKYGKEIDWEWLEGVVEQYHMTDYYNCINAICVEDLGFQLVDNIKLKLESQLESAEFRKLKERVLADILEPKFSRVPPDKRFLPKEWYMYRRWKGNEWKHKMCYNESMWSAFWSGVWNHLSKPASI